MTQKVGHDLDPAIFSTLAVSYLCISPTYPTCSCLRAFAPPLPTVWRLFSYSSGLGASHHSGSSLLSQPTVPAYGRPSLISLSKGTSLTALLLHYHLLVSWYHFLQFTLVMSLFPFFLSSTIERKFQERWKLVCSDLFMSRVKVSAWTVIVSQYMYVE